MQASPVLDALIYGPLMTVRRYQDRDVVENADVLPTENDREGQN